MITMIITITMITTMMILFKERNEERMERNTSVRSI